MKWKQVTGFNMEEFRFSHKQVGIGGIHLGVHGCVVYIMVDVIEIKVISRNVKLAQNNH